MLGYRKTFERLSVSPRYYLLGGVGKMAEELLYCWNLNEPGPSHQVLPLTHRPEAESADYFA